MNAKRVSSTLALLICAQLAAVGANLSGWARDKQSIRLTCPSIQEGLEVTLSGRNLIIAPGKIWVNDRPVTVDKEIEIAVPSCAIVPVVDEPIKFPAGGLQAHGLGTALSCFQAKGSDPAIVDCKLIAESVRVKQQPGLASKNTIYKHGGDYTQDSARGALTRTPSGSIKDQQTVYVDYLYTKGRGDALIIDGSDNLKLLPGKMAQQLAPEVLALANIYAEPGSDPLKPQDVLPVLSRDSPRYAPERREANRKALPHTLAKLREGQGLNIVFWGDSVTRGAAASDGRQSFFNLVLAGLLKKYPQCAVSATNAGTPASTTTSRLAAFDSEVLAKKPDLIVVEFLNDVRLSKSEFDSNYPVIVAKARHAGAEVILVNPHLIPGNVIGATAWKGSADRPYYQLLRTFANRMHVALADVAERWEHLDRQGLTAGMLLVDRILHPNDYGHSIYAEEILRCFE